MIIMYKVYEYKMMEKLLLDDYFNHIVALDNDIVEILNTQTKQAVKMSTYVVMAFLWTKPVVKNMYVVMVVL
ncbi:MAG: hypothetical protein WCI00_09265 [bacterium]